MPAASTAFGTGVAPPKSSVASSTAAFSRSGHAVGAQDLARPARRRPFWSLDYREARAHAILAACALWLTAAALFSTHGARLPTGPLKGADFVHFYTLGYQARHGLQSDLYDATAQHALQTTLVPESAEDRYLPVYPPQIAVLMAPLASLAYGWAAVAWALITATVYGALVWITYRRHFANRADPVFVVAAAAAFPPLWQLILHGQTTVVALVAFFLGGLAVERRKPFLAGLGFGLLAFKPQFGLALAVIVLARREWRMAAGAIVSAALQAGVVAWWLGWTVIADFAQTAWHLPSVAAQLEPKPYQLHSIKVLADLLPAPASTVAWLAVSAIVLFYAVRLWSPRFPAALRLGALVIATVLVSPHLTVYDLTVLVLPLLWLGGWVERKREARPALGRAFWACTYALFVVLLVPIAALIRLQPSVLILAGLFALLVRASASAGIAASTSPNRPARPATCPTRSIASTA